MEKRASNTFIGGLNTDRHPLTSQNTELIEAQNIDLLAVGEGYQLILQKREGNAKVLYITDGPVDAGLTSGFIPLTVKEFNNIAYIVSVNPDTGEGELGTFPSPDYSQFVYQDHGVSLTPPTIGSAVYDATSTPLAYGFTITPISPSYGSEQAIDGGIDANAVISYSSFTITNTGTSSDIYTIVVATDAHVFVYIDDALYVDGVNLAGGESATITFKVDTPFALTPEVSHSSVATITSTETADDETITIDYHTTTVFQVAVDGTWGYMYPEGEYISTLLHEMINRTGNATFHWRSNDAALTLDSMLPDPGPYAWITSTDITSLHHITIFIDDNNTGIGRAAQWELTCTYGINTITYALYLYQYPY